jgi:hypothetical protein
MQLNFRVLLPVAQAAFAIALLLTNCGAPQFRQGSVCDFDASAYCGPPAVPAVTARFVEVNLPALPVLAPSYFWLGGPDHPNLRLLVMFFGLAGIGIWFCVGRFLDDVAAALLMHVSPRRHIYDGLVFVFIIMSSFAVFVESDIASFALSSSQLVIRVCSMCWLLFGCTALLLRIGWIGKGAGHPTMYQTRL